MLKFVMAALLSFAIVGCGPTQEEKKDQATKDMKSFDRAGGANSAMGEFLLSNAKASFNSKTLRNHSVEDLTSIRAEFVAAKAKSSKGAASYADLLRISGKSKDTGVGLLNPSDVRMAMASAKAKAQEAQSYIDQIDEELARRNKNA